MEILELAEDKDRDCHSCIKNIGDKVIYVTKNQKKSGSSKISSDNIPEDMISDTDEEDVEVFREKKVSPKRKRCGIRSALKIILVYKKKF